MDIPTTLMQTISVQRGIYTYYNNVLIFYRDVLIILQTRLKAVKVKQKIEIKQASVHRVKSHLSVD